MEQPVYDSYAWTGRRPRERVQYILFFIKVELVPVKPKQ